MNTCGGGVAAVTAIPGATTVTLSANARILANLSCSVKVNVTAPVGASYFNVLPAGALVTDNGNNAAPALATLVVLPVVAPPTGPPSLSLSKTALPLTYTSAGNPIVYTYIVRNTGGATLVGPFTVNDDKLGSFQCGVAQQNYLPGASVTCTITYEIETTDLGTSMTQAVVATIKTSAVLFPSGNNLVTEKITGAGPGGVPDGTYNCWCIQDHVPGALVNKPAKLYSSVLGSLPADVAGLPWGKINYVLNHKIKGPGATRVQFSIDVQTAIWKLLGEPNPDYGVSATAQQMIDAANANPNFVPGPGHIVAVIVYSDGMAIPTPNTFQETICEMKSHLKSIVNKATATFGTGVVLSGEVQATVKQVIP